MPHKTFLKNVCNTITPMRDIFNLCANPQTHTYIHNLRPFHGKMSQSLEDTFSRTKKNNLL